MRPNVVPRGIWHGSANILEEYFEGMSSRLVQPLPIYQESVSWNYEIKTSRLKGCLAIKHVGLSCPEEQRSLILTLRIVLVLVYSQVHSVIAISIVSSLHAHAFVLCLSRLVFSGSPQITKFCQFPFASLQHTRSLCALICEQAHSLLYVQSLFSFKMILMFSSPRLFNTHQRHSQLTRIF